MEICGGSIENYNQRPYSRPHFFRVKKFFIPPLCTANAYGRNRPFKVKKFFASLN